MRKLKKAFSLTLALVLSLALAVPAFADEESKWDLTVAGKPDSETFVGERTFTLHNWIFADDEETETRTATKAADTENFKAENLCVAGKGDTLVITNGGEGFCGVDLMAWSDPNGDGVYDNRVMREYWKSYEDEDGWSFAESIDELLPADTAGPLSGCTPGGDGDLYYNLYFVHAIQEYNEATGDQSVVPGKVSIGTGELVYSEVTELRIPVDQLLEEFGPNTLFWIDVGDGTGWYVFLEGGAAAPAAGSAYVVSAKQGLNVRTGPGTNYPKARAALARNTAVQVVEVQGQWGKLANDAGWVFMPGLKAVSAPVTTPTTPETPEQTFPITMVVKNSKGALNVRTGPGADYKLATVPLRNGSVITIDKIEGQWGRLANYMDWWVYLPGAKTVKG